MMRFSSSFRWLLSFGTALAVFDLPVTAQTAPTLAQVQREIESARRDLENERQLHQADHSRRDAWRQASSQRLTDMRRQTERARKESDSLRSLLRQFQAEKAFRAAEGVRAESELHAFGQKVADRVERMLIPHLSRELPHVREEKERAMRDLVRGLRNGTVTPAEGLARSLNAVAELIDMGGKVEAVQGQYTTQQGVSMGGTFVRAGGRFDAFVSENGEFGAWRTMESDTAWTWKETLGTEDRQDLLRIARILGGNEEPGFVTLPLGLMNEGVR